MCQLIPPLSWLTHVLCWLLRKLCCTACCFSDVCDKKRHEVSPGQAPHADGEWTRHIWLFGVNQTSTINTCLCLSLLHREQLYFKKACISHTVWCCVALSALFPDCLFVFLHLLQQEGEIQSVKRGLHALFFPWRSFQFDKTQLQVPTVKTRLCISPRWCTLTYVWLKTCSPHCSFFQVLPYRMWTLFVSWLTPVVTLVVLMEMLILFMLISCLFKCNIYFWDEISQFIYISKQVQISLLLLKVSRLCGNSYPC